MTESGELVDLARPATPRNNQPYEYNDTTNRRLDSQIQQLQHQREQLIEQQRRKVEEENRKLEQLQNSNTDGNENSENTGKIKSGKAPKLLIESIRYSYPYFFPDHITAT